MSELTTPHLTQTYLGNRLQEPALDQQLANTTPLEVVLAPSDQAKGRIYTQTTQGEPVGITKERHWSLAEGDVFKTAKGQLLLIHLQPQSVIVLRITKPSPKQTPEQAQEQALALIHLGHTLGNHHWPILVDPDKIYIQLSDNRTVVENTLKGFQIPGLEISYESRSSTQQLSFSSHHHP